MSAINYDQVCDLLTEAGLLIEGELRIDTPKIVRTRLVDKPRAKFPGYYRLWEAPLREGGTCLLGVYGFWDGATLVPFKVPFPAGISKQMDPGALAAARERQKADALRETQQRKRTAARAADRASRWWAQCLDSGRSSYLERKGIPPGQLFGARLSPAHGADGGGNLIIPYLDGKGQVHGLQVIYQDPKIRARKGRDKDNAPLGMVSAGHWFSIGSPFAGGLVLLTEGFATAVSLHLATGLPAVVAFAAGNLGAVAKALVQRYRHIRLLICADDDYLTTRQEGGLAMPYNTGIVKANEVALALGEQAAVAVPCFAKPGIGLAPIVRGSDKAHKGPTDFNDLHVHPQGGLHVVRAQIEAALLSAGWSGLVSALPLSPAAARVPHPPTGSGEAETANRARPAAGSTQTPPGHHATQGTGKPTLPTPLRPSAVSQMALPEIVERFIHIDDATGEFAFDAWTAAVVRKTKIIHMLPARVRWDDIKDHPRWKSRAVYIDQIGFDPGHEDPNIQCNRWLGWPTQPVAGKCDLLLQTLRYLTEHEPREVYDWVLRWLAYPLQFPGAKMHSALVFHGQQGTGKSRFFESYAAIYGEYAQILNQGALEDRFNSDWAERKLFVVCDEVVARSELYQMKNQLKALITGEWIRVNPKNVAAHRERNHMNLVFLSNEHLPAVLEKDDRRHCVVWTPPKLDESWYDALSEEIDNGGIAALHHYLLNLPLGGFRPWARPPATAAKDQLIEVNRESVDRFVEELERGEIDGLPLCPTGTSDMYAAYLRWCRAEGVRFPRESNQFAGYLLKQPHWQRIFGDRYETAHYQGAAKRQRFFVPSEDLLEDAATRGPASDFRKPAHKTRTQWLTDSFFAFRSAVKPATEGDYHG